MDFITQNPYRVLGVFANDPLKVRTANIARIRAFNKVGKKCEFACDFTEIFGDVNRSDRAVDIAVSQLADSTEAKLYQLFWIHRTPFQRANTEIDTISLCDGAFINRAVLALNDNKDYQCRVEAINSYARIFRTDFATRGLFDAELFWRNENELDLVSKGFIDKISEIDDCLYSGERHNGIFWWFRQLPLHDIFRCNLYKKYKHLATNRLLKIIDNDGCGVAHWGSKYRKVLWIAQPCIDILDAYRNSDLFRNQEGVRAEVQISLNKLASCLLLFCKKTYDCSTYWHQESLVDMIDFIREKVQESLAYESKTKEACEDFIKKLEKEKRYLAPDEVKDQADKIRQEIEIFCKKPDEVRWSLALIRNCVQPLIEVKQILGVDNIYYKHISTKIADNAIYSCEIEVDAAERKYNNPANDFVIRIAYLHHVLHNAGILACNLTQYRLETSFYEKKFSPFYERVCALIEKYGVDDEGIKADISLDTDDDIYARCQDYNSLVEFTRRYSNSQHFQDAMRRIWKYEDDDYPTELTAKNLLAYKERYPNSHNDAKVMTALNNLLLGMTNGTIYDYRTLLRLYPDHPKRNVILERIDLLNFKRCKCITDWEEYIRNNPNGAYVSEARHKIQEAIYMAELTGFGLCKTAPDYNRFILQYPSSNLVKKAYEKIEELLYLSVVKNGRYYDYYQRYPNGKFVSALKRLEDEQCYKQCKDRKNLEQYLRLYPYGKYADIASKTIQEAKRRRNIIIAIIGVVLGTFVLLLINTQAPKDNLDYTPQPQTADKTNIATITDESETAEKVVDTYYDPDEKYRENSLKTGAKPYAEYFGYARRGKNYFIFKTSLGSDYVVIVKRHKDDKYIN